MAMHPGLKCMALRNAIRPMFVPTGWFGIKEGIQFFGEMPIAVFCFQNEGVFVQPHPELEVDVGDIRLNEAQMGQLRETVFYGNSQRGVFQYMKTIVISIKTDGTTDDLIEAIQNVAGCAYVRIGYHRNRNFGEGVLYNIHNKFDHGEIGSHQCELHNHTSIYHQLHATHPRNSKLPIIYAVSVAGTAPDEIYAGMEPTRPTLEELERYAYYQQHAAEQGGVEFQRAKLALNQIASLRIQASEDVVQVLTEHQRKRLRSTENDELANENHGMTGFPPLVTSPAAAAEGPTSFRTPPDVTVVNPDDVSNTGPTSFQTPPTGIADDFTVADTDRAAAALADMADAEQLLMTPCSDEGSLPILNFLTQPDPISSPLLPDDVVSTPREGEYVIDRIVAHRAKKGCHSSETCNLEFKVRWLGYDSDDDTYEPWDSVCETEAVQIYADSIGLELPNSI